jgi:hypothetical protein
MQSIVKRTTAVMDSYLLDGKTWLNLNEDHPEIPFRRFRNRYNYLLKLKRIPSIPGVFSQSKEGKLVDNRPDPDEESVNSPISQVEAEFLAKEKGLLDKITQLRRERTGLAKVAAAKNDNKFLVQETAWAMKKLPYVSPYVRKEKDTKNGTFVLCLHDVHIGQQTYSAFGAYDIEVFSKRCQSLTDQIIEVLAPYIERGEVQDLVILFGGDLVDGRSVYPGHSIRSTPRNIQFAVGIETMANQLLNPIAKSFPDLNIQCLLTVGNHGRYGRDEDSDDYLFYHMLMERVRSIPNISFHLPEDWWTYVKIYDWNIFAEHGDALKNIVGQPTHVIKKRREMMSDLVDGPIDLYIMGHIHTSIQVSQTYGYCVVNGCWPGTSEYGVRLGRGGLPAQKLIYVTEDNPVKASFELLLEEEVRSSISPQVLVKGKKV